jgi:D-glycero-D-manno-heptose 1,7-bisphosphate phosphatase
VISGVFIDRDGVINVNRSDYVKCWNEFAFENGVLSALKRLAKSEYAIVIISNQSAIGRGLVNLETIDGIHKQMLEQITTLWGQSGWHLLLSSPTFR